MHKGDCWFKDNDNKNKKVNFGDKGKTKAPSKFTMSEYSNMMKVMMESSKNFQKNLKSSKRKIGSSQGNFLDSNSDNEPASVEEINYMNIMTGMNFDKSAARKHWNSENDESTASA